jgi:hypothetical protein
MAVRSGQIVATTTLRDIPETCTMPWRMEIKNMDSTDDVFIGNGDVTTETGLRLAKEERITLTLAPLDRVFVISAKNTHQIGYIVFTQAC